MVRKNAIVVTMVRVWEGGGGGGEARHVYVHVLIEAVVMIL